MMKNVKKKNLCLAAAALTLTAGLSVGTAMAYFTTYATASGGVSLSLDNAVTVPEEEVSNWTKHITVQNTGDALRESKKFSQPPEYHAKTSGNLSSDPLKKPYGFLPWNLSGILRYLFRMFFRRDCFHLSPALLLCITLQFLSRNAFLRFIIRFRSFFFQGFFFRNHFFCGFFLRSFYVLSLFCLCGRSFAFLLFFPATTGRLPRV